MAEPGSRHSREYDIVIVGGGMVGATLAWALQATSYRCALIESADIRKSPPPGYDERSIVLSYGSSRILEWLELWPQLAARAEPIHDIHVSPRGRFGVTRIRAREERVPALGYVVPARCLGELLIPHLLQCPVERLRLYTPAQLLALRHCDDAVELELRGDDGPERLRTRLLVAADGADSSVRRLLHIDAATVDYRQDAVITNISTQCPHRNIAYERFTDSGPLALLPLGLYGEERNRCAVVWTLHAGQADPLLARVEARSAENLCASAQRGVDERKPRRACRSSRSTL
jgi:2-octaprenyl-6-methoxyphenol hydroxylase